MDKPSFNNWFTDTNSVNSKESDKLSEKLYYNLNTSNNFGLDKLKIDLNEFNIPQELLNKILNYHISATVDEVTTKDPDGAGAFDVFMSAISKHLEKEFSQGRIVGADYSNAYLAAMQMALQQAVDFVLKKDQVFITTATSQLTAINAAIETIKAKVSLVLAQIQAYTAQTEYANKKLALATLHEQYINLTAQYDNLLKERERIEAQTAQIVAQTTQVPEQIKYIQAQTTQLATQTAQIPEQTKYIQAQTTQLTTQTAQIPEQTKHIQAQTAQLTAQTNQIPEQTKHIQAQTAQVMEQMEATRGQTLGTRTDGTIIAGSIGASVKHSEKQIEVMSAQIKLLGEQFETARAQTLDVRSDNQPVKGQIGKQKDVASQQIIAFKQKAGIDAANIASNAWITSKGMNDAVEAPTAMQNAALNNVVDQVYANAGLPTTGNHKNNLNGSVPG